MIFTRPTLKRRFLTAAGKDAFSFVCGFSRLPLPIEFAREILGLAREKSPKNYTDWELREWPVLYRKEASRWIPLLYKGEQYFLPQIGLLDNSTGAYKASQIRVKLDETPFRLPDEVRGLTEGYAEKLKRYLEKKGPYYNGRSLRMTAFEAAGEGGTEITIRVQPLDYDDYVATNLVLDANSSGTLSLRETLLRKFDSQLESLSDSPLGNLLSLDVLLFTADGKLILQERSKKVAIRPGELCASFSGGVMPLDTRRAESLEELEVLREGQEEIGIRPEDIEEDSLSLLGVGRELIRGGQPGLFFCARIRLTEKDVRKRVQSAEHREELKRPFFFDFGRDAFEPLRKDEEIHRFLLRIDEFIGRFGNNASIPLLAALVFWVGRRCNREAVLGARA